MRYEVQGLKMYAFGDIPKVNRPIPKHPLQMKLLKYYQFGILDDLAYFSLWVNAEEAVEQQSILQCLYQQKKAFQKQQKEEELTAKVIQ